MAFDDLTQIAVVQSLKANSYSHTGGSAGVYNGSSVATSQHHRVLMLVNVGTAASGSSIVVKLQESDDDSTFTDVTGGTTGLLRESAGADETFYYGTASVSGLKKYVRAELTVADAACNVGVQLVLQPRDTSDSSTATFTL